MEKIENFNRSYRRTLTKQFLLGDEDAAKNQEPLKNKCFKIAKKY